MIVELQTHTPLTQWQPLHIHHAASHVTGRVSLLEDNLAELVFDPRYGWQITTAWYCAISLPATRWPERAS